MTLVDHSSSGLAAVLVLVLALTLALGLAGLGLGLGRGRGRGLVLHLLDGGLVFRVLLAVRGTFQTRFSIDWLPGVVMSAV